MALIAPELQAQLTKAEKLDILLTVAKILHMSNPVRDREAHEAWDLLARTYPYPSLEMNLAYTKAGLPTAMTYSWGKRMFKMYVQDPDKLRNEWARKAKAGEQIAWVIVDDKVVGRVHNGVWFNMM